MTTPECETGASDFPPDDSADSMPTLARIRVREIRTVEADVNNAPLLFTADGRNPIAPERIKVSYSQGMAHADVGGYPVPDPGRNGRLPARGLRFLVRRVQLGPDAPAWIRDFVAAHQPEEAAHA